MPNIRKPEYPNNTTMPPALSDSDAKELRRLIPLNTLPDGRFEQLCTKIQIEQAPKDSVLFRQGETKTEFVYLLSGTISLQAGGVEMDSVSGGTDTARFALAHQIPRKVSAVAKDTVRYVRIEPEIVNQQDALNRGLLTYKVSDIPEEPTRDWMTALLKSQIFQRLSPANIQAILRNLEEIEVKAGEVICRQGDPGDFYYIVKKGRCAVTRKPSRLAKEIKLATLKVSDTFGEDSLISGDPRSVTVTMLTDGLLLRLDEASFIKLLKEPVITHVDFETAQRMASRDAVWLDVRAPDAYEQGRLPGSLNIPFFSLRVMLPTLNRQTKYLLVCADGRLSEAGAFLLMRYSFEAHVLAGGIGNVPRAHLVVEAPKWTPPSSLDATACPIAEPEQPDSPLLPMTADAAQSPAKRDDLPHESEPHEIDRPETSEAPQNALDTRAPERPAPPESESPDPHRPTDQAPPPDAPPAVRRKENESVADSGQPAARETPASDESPSVLQTRLRELEAAVREGALRERDLARRLAASENAAAESVARARALEEQLAQAGDLMASAASIAEKRQQAEEQLLKAKEEIEALKTDLQSLRETHERLLQEKEKAEHDSGNDAPSSLQQEVERLKALNLRAIRDKTAAERQVEALAQQLAELQTATDEFAGRGVNAPDEGEGAAILRKELDAVRHRAADDLAAMQAKLRDMEEEGNRLRDALQSTRNRLAVLEAAARATDTDQRKKLHFEFAVTLPVTVMMALFLTALVVIVLFGTDSGRNFLGHWLAQTSQVSPEYASPKPMSSAAAHDL